MALPYLNVSEFLQPDEIIGPGESSMAHKTDEFCYISKIEAATEAYLEIAKKWCKL